MEKSSFIYEDVKWMLSIFVCKIIFYRNGTKSTRTTSALLFVSCISWCTYISYCCSYHVSIPRTNELGRLGGRSGCWWNGGSQIPLIVFKSSKWNLVHIIPMTCRWACHFMKPSPRVPELSPFFRKFFYVPGISLSLFSVRKLG